MALSENKLRELIATKEGQYHERKSLLHGPAGQKRSREFRDVRDQVAEYVAGFVNAEGGVLICGVEDDGTITGHQYRPDVVDALLAAPATRVIPPQPNGYRTVVDGSELLVFEVDSAPRAVRVEGDGYPYRIGDMTTQFSEVAINAIKDQGLVESAEARRSSISVADLDGDVLRRAVEASGATSPSIENYLLRRGLADRSGAGIVLREAAVLLFAATPEVIAHPNASIRVFRVDGTERRTGAQHNVHEFPRIEGNLSATLVQARALLETLIQRSAQLKDLFFQETPEYPTFAWQEAIVNAVAHRDYQVHGQAVEVWLYEDRLEVMSPGGVPSGISLDDLRAGEATHSSRNPRIARTLADLGVMRDQGEGIPRMFEEMESSFLYLPDLDVVGNRFRVRLQKHPIFRREDPAWVQAVRALPLSLAQKRGLVGLVDREFTNADYCALNGMDRDEAYRELKELDERAYLEVSGSGAATTYRVLRNHIPSAAFTTGVERLKARMTASGFVTNADYREAFGVGRIAAQMALTELAHGDALVREGSRRWTRYRPGPLWAKL